MEKSTTYEKFAQECALLMAKTATEADRKVLREMVESWNMTISRVSHRHVEAG